MKKRRQDVYRRPTIIHAVGLFLASLVLSIVTGCTQDESLSGGRTDSISSSGVQDDSIFSPFSGLDLKTPDDPNGLETMTGPEVLRAAAGAIRDVDSYRTISEGIDNDVPALYDICVAHGVMRSVITKESIGEKYEFIWVDDYTYDRRTRPVNPNVRPDQWLRTPSRTGPIFTIEGLAAGLEKLAREAATTVQRDAVDNWPAISVVAGDSTIWVSNVGPALPLLLTGVNHYGDRAKFVQYGRSCDVHAPDPADVYIVPGLEDHDDLESFLGN